MASRVGQIIERHRWSVAREKAVETISRIFLAPEKSAEISQDIQNLPEATKETVKKAQEALKTVRRDVLCTGEKCTRPIAELRAELAPNIFQRLAEIESEPRISPTGVRSLCALRNRKCQCVPKLLNERYFDQFPEEAKKLLNGVISGPNLQTRSVALGAMHNALTAEENKGTSEK